MGYFRLKVWSFLVLLTPLWAHAKLLSYPHIGCDQTWSDVSKQNLRTLCHKTWTVLIYMVATPDLVPYTFVNIDEMESNVLGAIVPSASSIRSDVLVQLNVEKQDKIRRIHVFTQPDKTYRILSKSDVPHLNDSMIQSPIVSILDKDPEESELTRLEKFVKWGIETYPSEHYLLTLWGHGKLGELAIQGSGRNLDSKSLAKVLKEVQGWSGDKLNLAADSCYWMAVDDIERISDCTHTVCGSSDVESYAGFPYGAILREINSGTFGGAPNEINGIKLGEPEKLAWLIPQEYLKSFDRAKGLEAKLDPDAACSLTGCSVCSEHFNTSLIPALNHLGDALLGFMKEVPDRWMDLKSLIELGEFYQNATQDTQDLGAFLKGLSDLLQNDISTNGVPVPQKEGPPLLRPTDAAEKLGTATADAYRALNYSVLNAVLGSNYPKFDPSLTMGPRGLAIWLPKTRDEFHRRLSEFSDTSLYDKTRDCGAPGWGAWMEKMYP